MKMIRWGGLIAFGAMCGLIAVFMLFFLDSLIKTALEKQASRLVGARVDIGNLDAGIFDLRIDMKNITIANPEQPMRNSLEAQTVAFDLAALPLLKKKFHIETMTIQGLAFDTARKTSGALPAALKKKWGKPEETPSVEERSRIAVKSRLAECRLPDFTALKDIKGRSPADLLKDVTLSSSEYLSDYQKNIAVTQARWESRMKELPTKESLENDLKSLRELINQRPADVTALPGYFARINALKQKVETAKKELTAARNDFRSAVDKLRQTISEGEMEKLRNQDLTAVMTKLNIVMPSGEDLVCVLVGKDLARTIHSALQWYRKLNAAMPAGGNGKEKEKPRPVPRMTGVDVRYPITDGSPDVLIVRAELSARSGVPADPEKLAITELSGKLEGFTTQPALYGKPALFEMKGSLSGEAASKVALTAHLDHRQSIIADTLTMSITGITMHPQDLSFSGESPVRVTAADCAVTSRVTVTGDVLHGKVVLVIRNPTIAVDKEAAVFQSIVTDIGTFDAIISLGGTLDKPSLSLSSSLSNILETRLQIIVRKELGELQTNLRKAIASRIDDVLKRSATDMNNLDTAITKGITERLDLAGTILNTSASQDSRPHDVLKKNLPF